MQAKLKAAQDKLLSKTVDNLDNDVKENNDNFDGVENNND